MFRSNRIAVATVTVLVAFGGAARQTSATTITFDAPVTAPVSMDFTPLGVDYPTNGVSPTAFETQGFTIGGRGVGGPPNFIDGHPDSFIVYDPTRCHPDLQTSGDCANDQSHYLAADHRWSLTPTNGGHFSLASLSASQVFGPGGCPICGDSGTEFDATTLTVVGYRGGVQVAQQTFNLAFGFQAFLLDNDPDWSNIELAVFPLAFDANGNRAAAAIDNINAALVPEPATLTLLSVGLLGMTSRFRGRRAAPSAQP